MASGCQIFLSAMSRSAFIDLTTSPTDSRDEIPRPAYSYTRSSSPIRFHVSTDSHDSKRRRFNTGAAAGPSTLAPNLEQISQDNEDIESSEIEAIDLTGVGGSTALANALSKQQEDAIKAQQSGSEEIGRSALTCYKCPVCMDTPVDATTTVCGMSSPPMFYCQRST